MELETNLTKVSSGSDLSLASSTHSLNGLFIFLKLNKKQIQNFNGV